MAGKDRPPSEVIPLAAEYVEKGLRGPGEIEDSVTDWVINIERCVATKTKKRYEGSVEVVRTV